MRRLAFLLLLALTACHPSTRFPSFDIQAREEHDGVIIDINADAAALARAVLVDLADYHVLARVDEETFNQWLADVANGRPNPKAPNALHNTANNLPPEFGLYVEGRLVGPHYFSQTEDAWIVRRGDRIEITRVSPDQLTGLESVHGGGHVFRFQ